MNLLNSSGHLRAPLGALLVALTVSNALAVDSVLSPLRTVAEVGQTAPGSPLPFQFFANPSLDGDGNALVYGGLGAAGQPQRGVWAERSPSSLEKIAVTGDPQPPAQSTYYHGPGFDTRLPLISNSGNVAFVSAFLDANGVGGIDVGHWLAPPTGDMELLATFGFTSFPTAPLLQPPPIWATDVNDAGQVSLIAASSVAYVVNATQARGVAVTSLQAPGMTGQYIEVSAPRLSELGLASWFGQAISNFTPTRGVWKEASVGNGVLVASQGQAAPGIAGAQFSDFTGQNIDNAGQVAFAAQTTAPTTAADSGIWAERSGMGLQPLILEGNLAPGAGPDVRFANLDRLSLHASFGSAGDVALRAGLGGPAINATNDSGIWLAQADGNVRLVAREGQPAPGVEAGVTFTGLNNSAISLVNAHGQVAFFGSLTGPGINASNDRGIWAETAGGELTLIARQGALHQTASGAVLLDSLSLGEGAFSDSGHIAFRANLTASGHGAVFVSGAVAIPEPATAGLGLFVVAALAKRRRQSTGGSPQTP
jgi:hypothetical protein